MWDRFFKNETDDREEMKEVMILIKPQVISLKPKLMLNAFKSKKANYCSWDLSRSSKMRKFPADRTKSSSFQKKKKSCGLL